MQEEFDLSVGMVILFIFFLPFIVVLIYIPFFYWNERGIFRSKLKKFKGNFDLKITTPIEKHFPFFNNLNSNYRHQFLERVHFFILNKNFVAREMDEVTDEMKAFIAGSAVQITFGFRPLVLAHFSTIYVHPDEYYNAFFKKSFKGETNVAGFIQLSWSDLVKGYAIPDNAINLGLHEMAHALMVENEAFNEEYHFIAKRTLDEWHSISEPVFHKLNDGEVKVLRKYAGTNEHEFFAVCVETFYENPVEFKNELPKLFNQLQKLLNFDPINYKRIVEINEV